MIEKKMIFFEQIKVAFHLMFKDEELLKKRKICILNVLSVHQLMMFFLLKQKLRESITSTGYCLHSKKFTHK